MTIRGSYQRTVKAEIHLNMQSEQGLTTYQVDMLVLEAEQHLNNCHLMKDTKTRTQVGIRVHFKE